MKIQIKYMMPLAVIASLFLSGCNDKKEEKKETFKTVGYYVKNKAAREARHKECMQMEEMTQTILRDCENVNIAIRETDPKAGGTVDTTGLFK